MHVKHCLIRILEDIVPMLSDSKGIVLCESTHVRHMKLHRELAEQGCQGEQRKE